MTRKEVYEKIKELNLGKEIERVLGVNYTRIKTEVLESFIAHHTCQCCKEEVKKIVEEPCKGDNTVKLAKTVVKLLAALVSKKILTPDDADKIAVNLC